MKSKSYLECGSLGLKSVLVADGSVDLFVKDVSIKDWDIAPVMVILKEVGGCLVRVSGKPYQLDGSYTKSSGFIVARDILLAKQALKAFNEIKKGNNNGSPIC
jgi:fructose-1,6-bisphosphatase/inositol monophosphatase family enzyme